MAKRNPKTGRFESSKKGEIEGWPDISYGNIFDAIHSSGIFPSTRSLYHLAYRQNILNRLRSKWDTEHVGRMDPFTGPAVPSPSIFRGGATLVKTSPGATGSGLESIWQRQSLGRDWNANYNERNLAQIGALPSATEAGGLDYLREEEAKFQRAHGNIKSMKERGRYQFNLSQMTDFERQFHELTKKFGSGDQGRKLAEAAMNEAFAKSFENIGLTKKERRRRELIDQWGEDAGQWMFEEERKQKAKELRSDKRRRDLREESEKATTERAKKEQAKKRFQYFMMTDREKEYSDLLEQFHGNKAMATAAQKKLDVERNLKFLPKIFNMSKMSNKTLGVVSKVFKGFSPVAAGAAVAGVALNRIGKFHDETVKADKTLANLANQENMYGSLRGKDGRMTPAGILALASGLDMASATSAWGQFNAMYGGRGMEMLEAFQAQTKGLDPWQRARIAQEQFKMSPEIVTMAMNYGKSMNELLPYRQKLVTDELAKLGITISKSSMTSPMSRLFYQGMNENAMRFFASGAIEEELSNYGKLSRSADSAMQYISNTPGGGGVQGGGMTISVNKMEVHGSSAKDMADDVMTQARVPNNKREAALDAMDGGGQ